MMKDTGITSTTTDHHPKTCETFTETDNNDMRDTMIEHIVDTTNYDKTGTLSWVDINRYGEPGRPIIELDLTAGFDLYGQTSILSMSNHNYISAHADELPNFVELAYHNVTVWAYFADVELNDAENDIINTLSDYPVLDEGGYNEAKAVAIDDYWRNGDGLYMLVGVTSKNIDNADDVLDAINRLGIYPTEWEGDLPWYSDDDLQDIADAL